MTCHFQPSNASYLLQHLVNVGLQGARSSLFPSAETTSRHHGCTEGFEKKKEEKEGPKPLPLKITSPLSAASFDLITAKSTHIMFHLPLNR